MQHDDSEPSELLAYFYIVIVVLGSCLAVGLALTGALGLLWHTIQSAMHLGSSTLRWCIYVVRVAMCLWYFRRKLWRLHRVKILALIMAVAISNLG